MISSALQASGGKRVIIVTNGSHTRRVHILWTKFYGLRGTAIVHAVPDDEYVANRWWRDPVAWPRSRMKFSVSSMLGRDSQFAVLRILHPKLLPKVPTPPRSRSQPTPTEPFTWSAAARLPLSRTRRDDNLLSGSSAPAITALTLKRDFRAYNGGMTLPATFCTVEEAIEEIRQGRMIVLVDDEDRENEGDLTLAAEKITPDAINFMAKLGRGLICLALTEQRCDELQFTANVAH